MSRLSAKRPGGPAALAALAAMLFFAGGSGLVTRADAGATSNAADDAPSVEVVSTRSGMVSDGSALVRVRLPHGSSLSSATVDGRDVTGSFQVGVNGETLGLVDELVDGPNKLEITVGRRHEQIEIVNHPRWGPIFSGPQQRPFLCQTAQAGLGAPLDEHCSAQTVVSYQYVSTKPPVNPLPAGCRRFGDNNTEKLLCPLPNPTSPPADVATTTTTEGKTVPYVIRLERGTINRAIYEIAILNDGIAPLPTPWSASDGWNRRLVYTYGGGQGPGYLQGTTTGGAVTDLFLRQGYAVASASLNVFSISDLDVVSAETTMMVKEHFIEQFGTPRYTIGWGGSGGSMQQHAIAHNYPGLLDGIVPSASFPDVYTSMLEGDSRRLLARYWNTGAQVPWTVEERDAVTGDWGPANSAVVIGALLESAFPVQPWSCPALVTANFGSQIYHPVTNPTGTLRCSIMDSHRNQLGVDKQTGWANQPVYDFNGRQFGLAPLNQGRISVDQFLDLNDHLSVYDVNHQVVPRAAAPAADTTAVKRMYSLGRIVTGAGLGYLPIVDLRAYTNPVFDLHPFFYSFVTRQRLIDDNGNADNQVMFVGPNSSVYRTTIQAKGLATIDRWLANMASLPSSMNAAGRVRDARPVGLEDACWTASGTEIDEHMTYGIAGQCTTLYPPDADQVMLTGEPLARDTLQCKLKKVDRDDYSVPFTDVQWSRLRTIFAKGVCDFSKDGRHHQTFNGTWVDYGNDKSLPEWPIS